MFNFRPGFECVLQFYYGPVATKHYKTQAFVDSRGCIMCCPCSRTWDHAKVAKANCFLKMGSRSPSVTSCEVFWHYVGPIRPLWRPKSLSYLSWHCGNFSLLQPCLKHTNSHKKRWCSWSVFPNMCTWLPTKDIVDLRKFIADEFSEMTQILREMATFLSGFGWGGYELLGVPKVPHV